MTAESTRHYSPLNDSDEIRLFRLQPRSHSEEISGTLHHVKNFDDHEVAYEALSYMWGPEDSCRTISINGKPFRVRKSLLTALFHLRYETEVRTLRIDAICINQDDVNERNR